MLPAFCTGIIGTTIVVVPLVALREDLWRRCRESGIEAHVWTSRGANRAAAIVFVTPESANTKMFRDFVNRLRVRQQLDRVVVDEYHMVLDAGSEFRPQLGLLGRTIAGWGGANGVFDGHVITARRGGIPPGDGVPGEYNHNIPGVDITA